MVQHWLRRGKRASAPPGPTHAVPPTAAFHKFNARPLGSSTFQGLNRTKWTITQEWGGGRCGVGQRVPQDISAHMDTGKRMEGRMDG